VSQTESARGKKALLALLALAVVGVGAFALSRVNGGGHAQPLATRTHTSAPSASTTQTPTPTPTPTPQQTCDGPNTQFNLAGTDQTSLLPDCGTRAVTKTEQQKSGLGLACGGSYPVILYKTTTSGAKTSICGTNASGESFRFVTQPRGGQVRDLSASYDPQRDAFVATDGGTKYAVLAYNGSLVVTKSGHSTTQTSDFDWISLDNEPDGD